MKPWEAAPERYEALFEEKCAGVAASLAPFSPPAPALFPSPRESYRVRAEFRMWHDGDRLDYVMFDPAAPRVPVPVADFVPAVTGIRDLMPRLRDRLERNCELRHKLFQIEFLSGAHETLVTLIYHRALDDAWMDEARRLADTLEIKLIGRSRKQKLVLSDEWVEQRVSVGPKSYTYRQYEQSFVQPNGPVNEAMLAWVWAITKGAQGDLLELYCGIGNFTLPLADRFERVLATELSKVGTLAARENIELNAVDNVQVVRLSSEEVSQALAGTRVFRRLADLVEPLDAHRFSTVFVDPPRAGLDEPTLACVRGFERILYISCNPVTLLENLRALNATHRIIDLAFFDQFPYTHHLECGVYLERR